MSGTPDNVLNSLARGGSTHSYLFTNLVEDFQCNDEPTSTDFVVNHDKRIFGHDENGYFEVTEEGRKPVEGAGKCLHYDESNYTQIDDITESIQEDLDCDVGVVFKCEDGKFYRMDGDWGKVPTSSLGSCHAGDYHVADC